MLDPLILWIIIVVLLLLVCFFSGAETALACCNRFKISAEAENGKKYAKTLLKILDNYNRALTTVLIGNNVVAIAISAIATTLFVYYFKDTSISEYVAGLISSIIITFAVFVIGDTLPKTIARNIPNTLSRICTYPIYFLMILFFPVTYLFDKGLVLMEKLFKVKDEEELTEEDFSDTLEKASEEDMIDEDQAEIVQSTLDYLDTNVRQVSTPKSKMFAIDIKDLNHEKLQKILLETNFSRIPVYDKVFDNMIGVLVVRIYLEEYALDPHVSIRSILQKPYFISNNVMIDDLFKGFKKHHTHLAFVRNKNMKVTGMVTMEDILEEIVSDISEPHRRKS